MSGTTQAFQAGRALLVLAELRGPWPVAELARRAERCAACVRSVAGVERGGT